VTRSATFSRQSCAKSTRSVRAALRFSAGNVAAVIVKKIVYRHFIVPCSRALRVETKNDILVALLSGNSEASITSTPILNLTAVFTFVKKPDLSNRLHFFSTDFLSLNIMR